MAPPAELRQAFVRRLVGRLDAAIRAVSLGGWRDLEQEIEIRVAAAERALGPGAPPRRPRRGPAFDPAYLEDLHARKLARLGRKGRR